MANDEKDYWKEREIKKDIIAKLENIIKIFSNNRCFSSCTYNKVDKFSSIVSIILEKDTTEKELKEIFNEVGEIEMSLVQESGMSKDQFDRYEKLVNCKDFLKHKFKI